MLFSFLYLFLNLKAHSLSTSFINLKEPQGWSCQKMSTEYLCRSNDTLEKKESFLVIKAKLAGRSDNLYSFYENLKQPLPVLNNTGTSALSKVYSVKQETIQGHKWVRALHLNSVTANYFTEYLVTIKGDLAIGIELNYHQSRFNKYKETMNKLVKSIQLVQNIASQQPKLTAPQPIQKNEEAPFITETNNFIDESPTPLSLQKIIYIGVGIILILGLLLLKKI